MPTKRKLQVFLCHASQDKPIVRELYRKLSAEPWVDPWLDEERLLPGQDWDLEIKKAVESSDAILVCLSSTSVSKEGYVQKELRKVIDVSLEKPEGVIYIIPIRLDECDSPRSLRDRQYIDYFPPRNRIQAYDKLLASLKLRKDNLGI
ncbi:MAG: toll/interleukin-1 receptor domain-containing protein [Chloroflexi bacterium]|nr:toll/interleukin-1 receptor domain-containing protein [Chloroflexota bacterium]